MKENSMSDEEKVDFSCLDPSSNAEGWNARIGDIVAQSQLLRAAEHSGENLSQLDGLAQTERFEQRIRVIADTAYRKQRQPLALRLESQVLAAGPRALVSGAILAAAAWLGAILGGGSGRTPALESPGLSLAMWAEQGRVPETREILLVIEVTRDER
jgi:hypothetical protein